MDWSKIIENLHARALSTIYENERISCLQKINEILSRHNISSSFERKEDISKISIYKLREIFIETYFSFFLKDSPINKESNTILYSFSTYELKYIAEEKIKQIDASSSLKFLKYMNGIKEWAEDELNYVYSLPKVLKDIYYFNYFIEIEIPFAIWCTPNYIFDECNNDKDKIIEYISKNFTERKRDFLEKVNNGYYDGDIKELFDPKLLTK